MPRHSDWRYCFAHFAPAVSAFPEAVIGSACASSFSRFARRSLALRPAHSRCHQFVTRIPKASAISSPPQLLRLLAAGAVAGWALHPLESAAWHGARQKRTSDDMAAEGGSSLLEGKPSSKCGKNCTGGCLDCASDMRSIEPFSEATE